MKILFLSKKNSCRSQMAEAILRNLGKNLEIYSAGIEPADHVSPVAKKVIAEAGIKIDPRTPQHYSKFENINFDYLITVGDGTSEELDIPSIRYKRKLHLGFRNPYKNSKNKAEIMQKCREIRDEIRTEMDYFYHKMLCK
jgi:arsenate reductase (thioredoxin)